MGMKPPVPARAQLEAIIERANSLKSEVISLETAIVSGTLSELDAVARHDVRHRIGALYDAFALLDHTLRRCLRGNDQYGGP